MAPTIPKIKSKTRPPRECITMLANHPAINPTTIQAKRLIPDSFDTNSELKARWILLDGKSNAITVLF
jgi:hypothetical protein